MEAIFNTNTKTADIRKLFKKAKEAQNEIESIKHSIKVINTSKYYEVYRKPLEKKRDLSLHQKALKEAYRDYDSHLENLELEITKERQLISNTQRYAS